MDSILINLSSIIGQLGHVGKGLNLVSIITILLSGLGGMALPWVISLILPRPKTITYGRLIYRILGTVLAKFGARFIKSKSALDKDIGILRTTLTDLSFGIYIESCCECQSGEVIDDKITKYLKGE
jgi:hypothetical protein